MAYSGRFVAENEVGNGLCKIIVDDDDRIIGCHMLGNPASELIVIAGIAIENGDTVEEFRKHVYPHPTVSEIIHETLFS
jgi:dihydrolipoamide dehydrogenase